MRIVLIGKKYILKEKLPTKIVVDYWLTDETSEQNKLINITIDNGNYIMMSSLYSKILDFNSLNIINSKIALSNKHNIIQNVLLKENNMYPILINGSEDIYIVCQILKNLLLI